MSGSDLAERIGALQADLDAAIYMAFKFGACEWVRLNYPTHYEHLVGVGPVVNCAKQDGDSPPDWAIWIVSYDDGLDEYWRLAPGVGLLGLRWIVSECRIDRSAAAFGGGA